MLAPAKEGLSPYGGVPIFTGPSEMMVSTIHLAMMGGAAVAFPVATFSVYQLVSPLLSRRRRRFVVLFLPAVFVFYLCGVAFAYFVMLPVGLKFLLHFGDGIAVPLISIGEYITLVTAMLFWLGVVFELPLVMFLLTHLRLVRYERFRRLRRYVPAMAFILSALLTPTFDVVNQSMVAIPIILLFEVGLFLCKAALIWRWFLPVLMAPTRVAGRGWAWLTGRLNEGYSVLLGVVGDMVRGIVAKLFD